MARAPSPYRGFRYPAEVIQHAVWLYHCFSLSLRDVETILAARGIVVNYETIRAWGLRFGRQFANELKRRRPKLGDKWHLDEVFIRIGDQQHYLWRAVDQNGHVLNILVQSRRNTKAAKRFFRKLLKGLQSAPRVIVTDKLKSYAAAKRKVLPHTEHRQSRYLNNRAEVSHQPTRPADAAVQVSALGTTLPLGSRPHPQPLPAPPPSPDRPRLSLCPRRRLSHLARGRRRCSRRVRPQSAASLPHRLSPQPDNAVRRFGRSAIGRSTCGDVARLQR